MLGSVKVLLRSRTNLILASATAGGVIFSAAYIANGRVVYASDDAAHHLHMHWPQNGFFSSFDHASLRRGYEVYRQVCSTCHSMKFVAFRHLVGHTHTEDQAKAIARSFEIKDGPNDEGEMFTRPGKLSDFIPGPYPNDEAARFSNNGALPPDLSCVAKGRHGNEDYIFSLLTGYRDPPTGITLRSGSYYNPYFPNGVIGMAPPLSDGQVQFEDGTYASVSQAAKDVAAFLAWASEPEIDDRKRLGVKYLTALTMIMGGVIYWKRFRWSGTKSRRISFVRPRGPLH
jgi:ubiquinol-cytochrome c reductase cytochrome c1 subunit